MLASQTFAGIVQINPFDGNVNTVGGTPPGSPAVAKGNPISGSISYGTGLVTGSNGVYTLTGKGPDQTFTFNVITGSTTEYTDNYSSTNTTALFQITVARIGTTAGATLTIEAYTHTGNTEMIVFSSSNYYGVDGLALPSTTAIFTQYFANTTAAFTWATGDPGNFGAPITSINGQTVPEPSSLVLMGAAVAIGGIGLAISRRKRLASAA
jgi:hypothetical protein